MSRHRTRSTAQTLGMILLLVVVVRLALDLLNLTCKAAAWVLLRACWMLEAAVDQLSTRETLRPSGVMKTEIIKSVAPPAYQQAVHAPRARPNPRLDDYPLKGSKTMQLPVGPREPDDVAKLMKILGRNDAETRRLAESMLANSTRVAVH